MALAPRRAESDRFARLYLLSTGSPSRARTLFYLGMIGLAVFELAKVYFIMPMPGSQRIKSLNAAYALHTWRWAFRRAGSSPGGTLPGPLPSRRDATTSCPTI